MTKSHAAMTSEALGLVALVGQCCSAQSAAVGSLTGERVHEFQSVEQLLSQARPLKWNLVVVDERVLKFASSIIAIEKLRTVFSQSILIILVDPTSAPVDAADGEASSLRFVARPERDVDLAVLIRLVLSGPDRSATVAPEEPAPSSGVRVTRNPRQLMFDVALTQIKMHFQPVVRWSNRSVFGYEALMRCEHPKFRNPVTLFDEAEQLDRLFELSREARAVTGKSISVAPKDTCVLVNIHVRDLLDSDLFDPTGPIAANPASVVIEVTERSSLLAVPDAEARIAQLRKLGFKIALDDLGAGYSGLTLVSTLEPEIVKVDMSLIRDIHLSKPKQTVVRSLLKLAEDIGAATICEGVETVEERNVLIDFGCDLFQGYYFGKPADGFTTPFFGA
jgi:EAL domain-containing protein (putative c-di-GMP-specific phosphodiesterase class I)